MAHEIKYYQFDAVKADDILEAVRKAMGASALLLGKRSSPDEQLRAILDDRNVQAMLINISRLPVFSKEMGRAFQNDLDLLRVLKQLKYFWNLPKSQLAILLEQVTRHTCGDEVVAPFSDFQAALAARPDQTEKIKDLAHTLSSEAQSEYRKNAVHLEVADPHAVYPTSIYRQCDALTLATKDASTIEAIMSTSLTTTIKITRDVLSSANRLLYDVYKPLGRCVAVIDDKVEDLFGSEIDEYFASHDIQYVKMVYSGNEADKDIRDVENILVGMKRNGVARNEPLLVIGGGVISDIAGFASSLYSRNTPYVMLCTSIVSGIDAGPSPRTCCNGFDYKNLYGAYHPPVLTITDRGLWRTLHRGWLRHGIAEIIKMSVVEDRSLFELLEKWGSTLVRTKFGTEGESLSNSVFQDECDLIVGKAMEGYVRSEYGNLWETHQCRPHAYGHTWSPGYELPAGMLHGHAVASCMGFGAYLAHKEGFIPEDEMKRILKLISDCELTLYHPVMDDSAIVWKAHVAMVEKRGGNLCAPVPKPLGKCGYINDITREQLDKALVDYKQLCTAYPRKGLGIEPHCVEVGLEDPQSKKENPMKSDESRFVVTPMDRAVTSLATACGCCRNDKKARSNIKDAQRILDGLSAMSARYTSQPSADLKKISLETAKTNSAWETLEKQGSTSRLMEAEMISGQVEGQLLQFLVRFGRVKTALDIGTFTGYSAVALAEALPETGRVVTLEREPEAARMAAANWSGSPHASKIVSQVGEASDLLDGLAAQQEAFDLIFLDVDKPGYLALYERLMESGMLKVGGLLVVDNTMYKGEEILGELSENGKGIRAFNEALLKDDRVSQVMLPLRDGVTLVHRVSAMRQVNTLETSHDDRLSKNMTSPCGSMGSKCELVEALRHHVGDQDLLTILSAIAHSVVDIGIALRDGCEGFAARKANSTNTFGDEQLEVDLSSDAAVFARLKESGLCSIASSEETTSEIALGGSKYCVAFDPLDGSSVVDANFSVGSIFGVWEGTTLMNRTGREQKAAIIAMYGPRITMAVAVSSEKVVELTYQGGCWTVTKEQMKIAPAGKVFAPGNLRASCDNEKFNAAVQNWLQEKYTLRYTGALVPDVYHILFKEKGIIANISSPAAKAKLRLLYECAPIAFIVEAAGGRSLVDPAFAKGQKMSILDLEVDDLDKRIGICYGGRAEVEKFEKYMF